MTGLIGRFPVGGNTWAYLQYVLGLKRLGFDVYYLEDSTDLLCYNPELNVTDTECGSCVDYLRNVMNSVGMTNKWIYRVEDKCYGLSRNDFVDLCKDSELFFNISGSTLLKFWLPREEYKSLRNKIYVDTDPAFTQFRIANEKKLRPTILSKQPWKFIINSVEEHDVLFTFGENIGEPDCQVPDCNLKWYKTRQPILLDMWPPKIDTTLEPFTTVMNWKAYNPITYNNETYGQKDIEFLKFIDLPNFTNQRIELAMSGGVRPKILLDHGWSLVSGIAKERRDMWSYQRYIQQSRAEWSIAKNIYVKTWCGWFSERSACYLASAKPTLLQDTGFSKCLPTGRGLIPFRDMEGLLKGIDRINSNYLMHCEAARQITEEYFASDKVLKDILRKMGF